MEEITGVVRKLEYTGTFEKKEFATVLRDAVEGFGYSISERDVTGGSGKLKFSWICERNLDGYTKAVIDIKSDLKAKEGETTVLVDIKAKLFTDYKNKWEKHPMQKIIKEIYDSTIYRSTLKNNKDKINNEVMLVIDSVKQFFNMYRIK